MLAFAFPISLLSFTVFPLHIGAHAFLRQHMPAQLASEFVIRFFQVRVLIQARCHNFLSLSAQLEFPVLWVGYCIEMRICWGGVYFL